MATDYVSEWMTDELRALRDVARQFFEREAAPLMAKWSEQRFVDREFWVKAGSLGLLCPTVPEEYGGPGGTILHQVAITEEQSRVLEKGWGNNVHSGVVTDYILKYGSEEQRRRWLPSMVAGTLIGAIAMTEPGAGQRRAGDDRPRPPRRRRVRHRRHEDLHHQRPDRRPDHRRGQAGEPGAIPPPIRGRSRCSPSRRTRPRASTAARRCARSASTPPIPRSCSSTGAGCPSPTASATRAPASPR